MGVDPRCVCGKTATDRRKTCFGAIKTELEMTEYEDSGGPRPGGTGYTTFDTRRWIVSSPSSLGLAWPCEN